MSLSTVNLGALETEVIRYVTNNPGASGRQIAEALSKERGLARTTVLTILARLRAKSLLSRRKRGGVYCYKAEVPANQVLRGTVQRFVSSVLGGSLSPVLAFLEATDELTEKDIDELERLVKVQRERRMK